MFHYNLETIDNELETVLEDEYTQEEWDAIIDSDDTIVWYEANNIVVHGESNLDEWEVLDVIFEQLDYDYDKLKVAINMHENCGSFADVFEKFE